MCYETEKNKSESIEPVLMYNLQGQHLAANIKIVFSPLKVVLLNNLGASRWLFFPPEKSRQLENSENLETLDAHSSPHVHEGPN